MNQRSREIMMAFTLVAAMVAAVCGELHLAAMLLIASGVWSIGMGDR